MTLSDSYTRYAPVVAIRKFIPSFLFSMEEATAPSTINAKIPR
jgi:hypothetical protein